MGKAYVKGRFCWIATSPFPSIVMMGGDFMDSYCVYRHTAPNGKMYVGVTKRQPEKRWKNGNGYRKQSLFFNAIQKYGWENFKHEILLDGLTRQQASLAERLFIGYWHTNDRQHGYNIATGGVDCGGHSEETKEKLSQARRGEKNPMYGVCGKDAPMYGKHHTEEAKYKNRIAHLGRRHTEESKRKMSESRRNERSKNKRPVYCVELDRVFWGAKEAWMEFGISRASICMVCKGQRNIAGGYHWKYYDEYIKEK